MREKIIFEAKLQGNRRWIKVGTLIKRKNYQWDYRWVENLVQTRYRIVKNP